MKMSYNLKKIERNLNKLLNFGRRPFLQAEGIKVLRFRVGHTTRSFAVMPKEPLTICATCDAVWL